MRGKIVMKSNYLDIIEKRAKGCFKGKFKITLALIVSLMINGVASGVEVEPEIIANEGRIVWDWSNDIVISESSSQEEGLTSVKGVEVVGTYPSSEGLLTSKIEVDLINENTGVLNVINTGGISSGIYIPGTDKLFEFYADDTITPYGNSYFRAANGGQIDVKGKSAYGIHLEFLDTVDTEEEEAFLALSADEPTEEEEEDPVYAYPDIEVINGTEEEGTGEVYAGEVSVEGDVEAEGIRIDTPFAKVSIDNPGIIEAHVGVVAEEAEEPLKEEFGGATGINVFLTTEVEQAENPTPDWISEPVLLSSSEEEISSLPMNVSIDNSGDIEARVENREVARIMGINVGEYDDHTLTEATEIIEPVPAEETLRAALTSEDEVAALTSSDSGGHGNGSCSGGSDGCGSKPVEALVFNNITNKGRISIAGENLSAVQAVGINSRMSEGTQTTIENSQGAEIDVEVTMKDARQTNIAEDPTSGNLYGINVFNSGRPSRIDANNNGNITVNGTIEDNSTDMVEGTKNAPVGIQSFGIKAKARGRESVSDINNTGKIVVTSTEGQNSADLDYTYTKDTEGKEIFGARAVGVYGTSAGRGAYTEITNGDYDLTVDQEAMDSKRSGETLNIYSAVTEELKDQYEGKLDEFNTYNEEAEINASIGAEASSTNGYAEAKGIWATAEAIENSQFIYNSEDSAIIASATASERGAEALGIESVSYQNTVINQGLIEATSNGRTATGVGILAEVSELEEEEMNEHAQKPEFIGADIGMPPDLPGSRDDHQGGENSGSEDSEILLAASLLEEIQTESSEISLSKTDAVAESEDEETATETKRPAIGIKNKYILNTGVINVDVNNSETLEGKFAFGAGIASSRVVPEIITEGRVDDFKAEETDELRATLMATADVTSEDGGGVAPEMAPEESLNQYITNNGSIAVKVKGDTALASGISSLTKVETIFDSDGDGVSDGVDIAPLDPKLSRDLDGDGIDNKVDPDADGDGFYNEKYINSLSPEEAEGLLVDYFDHDSDNDGINNRKDNDDDGDGILDIDDDTLDQGLGFLPITEEEHEKFMDTPGGMPENLIETTGIIEPEEVEINNSFTNSGDITVESVSEGDSGMAIANGIASNVVWNGLQKPVYEKPEGPVLPKTRDSAPKGVQIDIIENNYDSYINTSGAEITATATAMNGAAAAFGMRAGSYYTIEGADSERTPITRRYAGNLNNTEDGSSLIEYGMVNEGTIEVSATGLDAKAFGIMAGHPDDTEESKEEFVISTVKNTGDITVSHNGTENSEGAGIVALADQQIEYLPEVLEGGVLLPVVEEEEDGLEAIADEEEQVILEDYVIKEPEMAVAIVENSGRITINNESGDKNYGIYAGINPVEEIEDKELISVKEIDLTREDIIIQEEPILAEPQNGDNQEPIEKQIGTLYTVIDGVEEYQFVIHAPEDIGEEMPDSIYVVVTPNPDDETLITPFVEETYKLGETYLEVKNNGEISVENGIGIYLATGGTVNNSGIIEADKAIVTSDGDDVVNLNDGSEIYGDIQTGEGDDAVNLSKGSKTYGDIQTGNGDDTVNISDGAILIGDVLLGEGDDHFIVKAGASVGDEGVIYTVDGGEGEDRITLNGDKKDTDKNIIDSRIENFESAKIHGEWTLKGNGGLIVNKGDVVIGEQSNLIVAMAGTPEALEAGEIVASKLVVDGNLTYDIESVDKVGTDNFTYQLTEDMTITATSGEEAELQTNTYAWTAEVVDETTPEINAVESLSSSRRSAVSPLDFTATDAATAPSSISFRRAGFIELAYDINDGVASVLDADFENNNDTQLAEVYDILENELMSTDMDEATAAKALNNALEDIKGTEYAAYPFINITVSREFHENVRSFMDYTDSTTLTLSGENAPMVDVSNDKGVHQYVNIFGNFGEYDGSDTEGFNFDSYGVILANDKELESGDRLGLSYGYADTDLDFDDGGSGETKTFHIGGYHKKEAGSWKLRSILAFDYNKNDVDRVVLVGDNKYEPSTDFDSYVISAGSQVSYDYNMGGWIFRPLAGLTYSRIEQDSFKEDTVVGVEKSSEGYNSLVSEAGVEAIKEFLVHNTQLKLHFNISWLHEYGDIYDEQTLKLAGGSYEIPALDVSDNIYRLGVGLETHTNGSWSFNVRGSYEEDSSYDGYKVSTGFKYIF